MIKRKYKRIGKGWITNSHYVWNKHHPEDPIEKGGNGFVIHHKDENKKNDDISNLVKMSDFKHRSLHSKGGANALAKWRKENPEKWLEVQRNWRKTDKAKKGAKKRNNIPEEMIDLIRQRIIMKRNLKAFKQWRQKNEPNNQDVHGEQRPDEKNHEGQLST